jgi:hypothetical protein
MIQPKSHYLMKTFNLIVSCSLGLSLVALHADARGDSRGGGGGGRSAAPSRSAPSRPAPSRSSGSSASRNPATGSKIERPAAKPAPKPAARPAAKPDSKPAQRPEAKPATKPVQRPTTRPETLPGNKPGGDRPDNKPEIKPGGNRPDNKPDGKPGGNRPDNKPDNKPGGDRPDNKPDIKPGGDRPDNKPDNKPGGDRPDNKPDGNRPDNKPDSGNRPGNNDGPLAKRPDQNRPSTLPGMVSYPKQSGKDRTNVGDRNRVDVNKNRVDIDKGRTNIGDRNRVNVGDRNNVHIDNVNVGRRNVGLNHPSNLPAGKRNWDSNKWGGNHGVWGNNNQVNVKINNNFRYNNNYSYRPNYWGARPWWGAGSCHTWHHGHWGYGWNSRYYHSHWYYSDNNFASGFMWGIAVWSLGNMIYDMGYQSYRNPYPAPPVRYNDSKSTVTYTEPISVMAAASPPGDESATTLAETKSAEALEVSRTAFKQGDYIGALKSVDESLGYTPGDVTLHEYRALVMFALGKYADAAGVLNPVLASGPGWGWDTMVGFYNSSSTYTDQLRKLEDYVKGKPNGAEGHFLLGYHYMVCGHMDKSFAQFGKTVELQPADSIARQLRDLTKSSLPDDGEDDSPPPVRPAPVPADKLVGTWISDRGKDGKVTFTMKDDGNYTWSFMNGDNSTELKGTYGLDDKGLLVLSSDDSQMVSEVVMTGDKQMKFVLIGAPDGDPGLDFTKS